MDMDPKHAPTPSEEIRRSIERMAAAAESQGRSRWNPDEEAQLTPLFEEFCRRLAAEKGSDPAGS